MNRTRFPFAPGTTPIIARPNIVSKGPPPDPHITPSPVAPPDVRLPMIPAQPYIPPRPEFVPNPQPPPILGIAEDYESQTVPLKSIGPFLFPIYKTARRWRACDVYIGVDGAVPTFGVLTILVYGASQAGQKTLVKSGRIDFNATPAPLNGIALTGLWVAAARAVAERYEVWGVWTQAAAAGAPPANIVATVVAAEQAVEPSDEEETIGTVLNLGAGIDVTFNEAAPGTTVSPNKELIAVECVNPNAAARFLHAFDIATAIGVPANGTVPVLCWPLGAVAGSGIVDHSVRYRAKLNLVLAASTTAATFTNGSDCPMAVLWR